MSAQRAGERAVAVFAEIIEVTDDAGEAFWAIGKSYDALMRSFARHNRPDLAEKLREWKRRDTERLKHAQGRSWW